jgi:hypothetical protein
MEVGLGEGWQEDNCYHQVYDTFNTTAWKHEGRGKTESGMECGEVGDLLGGCGTCRWLERGEIRGDGQVDKGMGGRCRRKNSSASFDAHVQLPESHSCVHQSRSCSHCHRLKRIVLGKLPPVFSYQKVQFAGVEEGWRRPWRALVHHSTLCYTTALNDL